MRTPGLICLVSTAAVLTMVGAGCTASPSTPVAQSAPASTPVSSSPPAVVSTAARTTAARSTAARTTGPRTSAAAKTTSAPARPATSTRSASASPTLPPVPSGTTIVLNPGHNGADAQHTAELSKQVPAGFGEYKDCETTGTETNAGYPEHAFNWDVALRVRTLLQARGVHVILTRPSDTGFGPCVDERARIGNQAGVAAVVSIHADGAATTGHGFHVEEDTRQPGGAAVAAQSHALTAAMHDALLHGSGMTVSSYLGSNGYLKRSDLAGLNLATVPATFLEIGNMRNSGDAALQTAAAGRQRIAVAVAAGILAWLGR